MATVNVIYVENMREGYPEIARTVMEKGAPVTPRGKPTLELMAPTIVLDDPSDALPLGVNRGVNLRIAAVEALQLLAGQAASHLVVRASDRFRQYQEPSGIFWGNYGDRIGLQFAALVERLRQDPASRQCVVTLWRSERDLLTEGKNDYPCTIGFQFLIRGDQLHMVTTMRSNDVWLGLTFDVFQFTQLQLSLAACLGIEPGGYVHQPGSLHAYVEDLERIRDLKDTPTRGPIEEVRLGLAAPGASGVDALTAARQLLQGEEHEDTLGYLNPEAAAWYRSQLESLR